ncbi:hypothetical protein JMJ77_0008961, partial [Colletotrichum scovillei]
RLGTAWDSRIRLLVFVRGKDDVKQKGRIASDTWVGKKLSSIPSSAKACERQYANTFPK